MSEYYKDQTVFDYDNGLGLTLEESRQLAAMSYIDWKQMGINPTSYPSVREALEDVYSLAEKKMIRIPTNGGYDNELFVELLDVVLNKNKNDYENLLNMKYSGYYNNNWYPDQTDGNGVVIIALEDKNGNTVFASTGSEGDLEKTLNMRNTFFTWDWKNNFRDGAGLPSLVYGDYTDFVTEVMAGKKPDEIDMLFIGHSRGQSPNLYLAEYFEQYNPYSIGFNGLGNNAVSPKTLASSRMVNFSTVGDIVALLAANVKTVHVVPGESFIGVEKKNVEEGKDPRKYTAEDFLNFFHDLKANAYSDGKLVEGKLSPLYSTLQQALNLIASKEEGPLDTFMNLILRYESEYERELAAARAKEAEKRFVVNGAIIECDCGLRESQLLMPESNGIYIHDQPQAGIHHSKPENIISFCGCSSDKNPDTLKEQEKLTSQIKEQRSTVQKVVDWITGLFVKAEESPYQCAATGKCDFATHISRNRNQRGDSAWLEQKETVYLGENQAILQKSKLVCRYGGIISITHCGQQKG